MNPRPHPTAPPDPVPPGVRTPTDIATAALTQPPPHSSERNRRLLRAASECGVGGQALSVVECIDIAELDAHDRITYLKILTAHAAWLEAAHTIAVAAVSGPSGGWVEAEIEDTVTRDVEELASATASPRDREHLAAQARDEAWEVRERAIALEVSMAMRVSPRTAGRRINGARLLLEQLRPAIHESLAGRWGYGHLRVVEKELGDIPSPLRAEVFGDVLPYAATDHPRRLTERIRKSLARRDAAGSAERMRERAKSRDVSLWNLPDGQARLVVTGPYNSITRIHRVLTDLAKARRHTVISAAAVDPAIAGLVEAVSSGDPASVDSPRGNLHVAGTVTGADAGTVTGADAPSGCPPPVRGGTDPALAERRLGPLRYDALLEAVVRMEDDMDGVGRRFVHSDGGDSSGNLAEAGTEEGTTRSVHSDGGDSSGNLAEASGAYTDPWTGPRVHAPGSNPAPQAAVIVDLATALGMADEPGYLPGYGWVPAPIAREILADTERWRRWLVDDSSRKLIEAGTVRYRPSQALRDLVAGRDLTCTADTCTRPAADSQLDHAVDFDGSNTTPDNVHAVCGPDHLVVTAGHFIIDTDEEGRISWLSTTSGHAYSSHPDLLHELPSSQGR